MAKHKTQPEQLEKQPVCEQEAAVENTAEELIEEVAEAQVEQDAAAALQAENEELKNKVLRQMAEFDNFRKRTAKEKADLALYVKSDCAEPLIVLMDNFERALGFECTDESYQKGIEMLFEQFKGALTKLGIEEIDCVGKPFDPTLHDAVNQVQDENFGENTVCQVFQKGYQLGDKVVRHAMVVVANP